MFEIIKADQRNLSDYGWLKTYHLFSFADYFDPQNIRFGDLRVFNDDRVKAGKGFPKHHHDEMEIITIILEGELSHEDDMGNQFTNQPGDVQRMSAGTGVRHAEWNNGDDWLHLYQIWIETDKPGIEPSYEQKHFEPSEWENQLLALASGQDISGAIDFHADATIYRAAMDAGKRIAYEKAAGRKIFIYLTSGKLTINSKKLDEKDQARIEVDEPLMIEAVEDTDFVLIDLAK